MSAAGAEREIAQFGDRALRFVLPRGIDRRSLLARLRADPAFEDVILAEELGAVTFAEPGDAARAVGSVRAALTEAEAHAGAPPASHVVHVVYDGEDLAWVAAALGLTEGEVVRLHEADEYEVAMLGFMPGFAYLRGRAGGLHLPRRASPRTRVAAKSLAIAAGYTGIYPFASPGGWHVIGHACDFTPFGEDGARFAVGDHVRFMREALDRGAPAPAPPIAVARAGAEGAGDVTASSLVHDGAPRIVIEAVKGPAVLVDGGRPGHMHEAVPRGGPLVTVALGRANAAVGNQADACGIEVYGEIALTALGTAAVVADDTSSARVISPGETFRSSAMGRTRARYVAVGGGFDVPPVLGSRSTLLALGMGGHRGRWLAKGDAIAVGRDGARRADRADPWACAAADPRAAIRLVLGPDVVPGAVELLLESTFRVAPASDRTGTRLLGPAFPPDPTPLRTSAPMVLGAIELTPAGLVVLGPDHPTTGGYPVVAVVAGAALDALFARPLGAEVRFTT